MTDLHEWHTEQVRRIKAHHRRFLWRMLTTLLLLYLLWRQAELYTLVQMCRDFFATYGG
jgi:hypothetical protein